MTEEESENGSSNIFGETIQVSDDDAIQLLQKMIQYGYFQDEEPVTVEDAIHYDDTMEDMKRYRSSARTQYSLDDSYLIFTNDNDRCMTREFLKNEIKQIVRSRGKISMNVLASELDVNFDVQILAHELSQDEAIHLIGINLFTDEYLDEQFQQLHKDLQVCKYKIISEVANEWNVPLQFTFDAIVARRDKCHDMVIIKDDNGVKRLMTKDYENQLLQQVQSFLENLSEPVKLHTIGGRFHLNTTDISEHIKQWCQDGVLEGSLHKGQGILGATYTPDVHEQKQEMTVLERFNTSGFITLQQASSVGMSHKRVEECILQHNAQAIVLENSIFHPSIIPLPLQVALDETMQSKSFVDLSLHISDGVSDEDIQMLIEKYVFTSMDDDEVSSGCLLVADGEVLYFSSEMISFIKTQLMPSLIEPFAIRRAKEIFESQDDNEPVVVDIVEAKSRKKKGKSKGHKKRSRKTNDSESIAYGIVPLTTISKAVTEQYPDLVDIQETNQAEDGVISDVNWDTEGYHGPLYEFCRNGLRDSKFEKDCEDAIKAELRRLLTTQKGKTLQSRKQGVAKVASIEKSFENSFKAACISVQIFAKLPRYLLNNTEVSEVITSKITRAFLCGCGADFCRRITEYCLFKYGVEDGLFHFDEDDDEDENTDPSDSFYSEVDVSRRKFPGIHLSCNPGDDGEWTDPLKLLRDELPGPVGVGLARLWILTGGRNYSGGRRVSEDGTVTYRPGNFDQFLTHLEESCLSICGLPFKMLDKKSEKHFLFARKKQLQTYLQESKKAEDIYELSVVLLLQQVKNLVLCGDDTICKEVCENALIQDKKIPPAVAELFIETSQLMKDEGAITDDQASQLKSCGLSKDISNHSIELSPCM